MYEIRLNFQSYLGNATGAVNAANRLGVATAVLVASIVSSLARLSSQR